MDNTDKVVGFLKECQAMKLKVVPANINTSYTAFCVNDDGGVWFGLGAIKGVGFAASEHIVEEREAITDLIKVCLTFVTLGYAENFTARSRAAHTIGCDG